MNTESVIVDHRVQLLHRHWNRLSSAAQLESSRPEVQQSPTIAVSREAGARGLEVAREVGKRLDWPVYDREIVDLIAEETGLRSELLRSVDEHDPNWLVEAFTSFTHHGAMSSAGYVHHLVRVLTALAAHGRCVIVGRGATALLPRATTLRLRIVADLGDRVRWIAREQNLSEEAASAEVERIDGDRARFVANHFRRDIEDPRQFDLVVNTSRYSPEACAKLAIQALRFLPPHAAASRH